MSSSENIKALEKISQKLNGNLPAVENSKISNPAKEMEESISGFLTSRLEKLTEDADFERMIKDNILTRLDEASFEELTSLLQTVTSANTNATNGVLSVFHNESSGKIITDHLRSDSISNTATEVYNSIEDKNVLQALSYLNQIMGQLSKDPE